ncbi:MaoC family dehydratase [Pseudomonas sp. NA-150]|uniref:MaoC family dehydratase n=1 Tax=Pseudomonas sp. NA-150 TaxID=3367525 RepID=UPI0037C795BC
MSVIVPPVYLFLEDLAVGEVFRSTSLRVEAEQIKAFAEQFDPQPFHLDEETAQHTFFHGLAASGWHTAAITMRLLVQCVPLDCGMIGAGSEINWPLPTRPGDELRVESEIIDISPSRTKPDRGLVTCRTRTLNQRDEVVQLSTSKLLVFRRSQGR